ncbi:MAG: hypothetical protein ILO68_06640 [Clostridia bacterium]|nr:hypothetical protein [Clostridia bacterium]
MRAWKAVIDETVVMDPNKYAEVISSMEDCKRYLELCREQGIQTRTLLLCSDDGFSVRWKGDVPEGKRLGYEFCSSVYSDPEFLWSWIRTRSTKAFGPR